MTLNDTWGYAKNDHNWKPADDLVHKLCDIASKGGNFLLNVGPTELGEFTPETMDRLATVGKWMKVNGASIYGTTKSPFKKTPFDGRCTVKGNTLYLQVFHWPDGALELTGLKTPVISARVLGGESLRLKESSLAATTHITRPTTLDPIATVVELKLAAPPAVVETIAHAKPDASGNYTLTASDAVIQGDTAQVESKGDIPNIGFWINAKDTVSWNLTVPKGGSFVAELEFACEDGSAGSTYRVEATAKANASGGPTSLAGTVPPTGSWVNFRTEKLSGTLSLPAGAVTLRVIPVTMPHGAVMNLRRITLRPAR